ncbi:MAG: hypothetical protein SGPRY_008339, partial [Prymnesium sp.]
PTAAPKLSAAPKSSAPSVTSVAPKLTAASKQTAAPKPTAALKPTAASKSTAASKQPTSQAALPTRRRRKKTVMLSTPQEQAQQNKLQVRTSPRLVTQSQARAPPSGTGLTVVRVADKEEEHEPENNKSDEQEEHKEQNNMDVEEEDDDMEDDKKDDKKKTGCEPELSMTSLLKPQTAGKSERKLHLPRPKHAALARQRARKRCKEITANSEHVRRCQLGHAEA